MSGIHEKAEATLNFDVSVMQENQSNTWDAWRWRKFMWLAICDGAVTLGASLHEDMTKLISVRGRPL